MYGYKIENGRYVAEFVGEIPEGTYQSGERIDCTRYAPDENGNPVLIPEPEPAPEPVPYVPTAAERQNTLVNAVQSVLDSAARAKGYDGIVSAVSYAPFDTVPQFQNEGLLLGEWRSECWNTCYGLLAQVQAGTANEPTVSELIEMLPASPFYVGNFAGFGNDSF